MSIYAFSLLRRPDHSARFTASQPKCTRIVIECILPDTRRNGSDVVEPERSRRCHRSFYRFIKQPEELQPPGPPAFPQITRKRASNVSAANSSPSLSSSKSVRLSSRNSTKQADPPLFAVRHKKKKKSAADSMTGVNARRSRRGYCRVCDLNHKTRVRIPW